MIRFLRGLLTFLPHLIIAPSLTLLTLSITDRFNSAMAFINHPMTKGLILLYCVISLAVCVILLIRRLGRTVVGLIPSLICVLINVILLLALLYDRLFPREILFARDFGKNLIILNTVVSLFHAAYSAAADRAAAFRRYRKGRSASKSGRK